MSAPATSPEVLRDLAAILRQRADDIEAREPSRRARQSLSPEKLEELADMYLLGDRPTVGWWRRALAESGCAS